MWIGAAALFIKAQQKVLMIQFEDNTGIQQTPTFQFIVNNKHELETFPEQAYAYITNLKVNAKKPIAPQQSAKLFSAGETRDFFCKYCGSKNDTDAVWCQSCGKQIKGNVTNAPAITETVCGSCGTKNNPQATFCKKCGKSVRGNV